MPWIDRIRFLYQLLFLDTKNSMGRILLKEGRREAALEACKDLLLQLDFPLQRELCLLESLHPFFVVVSRYNRSKKVLT
jgi:hypothetical protein